VLSIINIIFFQPVFQATPVCDIFQPLISESYAINFLSSDLWVGMQKFPNNGTRKNFHLETTSTKTWHKTKLMTQFLSFHSGKFQLCNFLLKIVHVAKPTWNMCVGQLGIRQKRCSCVPFQERVKGWVGHIFIAARSRRSPSPFIFSLSLTAHVQTLKRDIHVVRWCVRKPACL